MSAKPEFLLRDNLLTAARASVGANIWRKLYYRIGGRKIEVLCDGNLSCAFFVSSVLKIFSLIPEIHTTVLGAVKDMKRAGWRKIGKPRAGAVMVYAPKRFRNGATHKHLGIYVSKGLVVSNRDFKKSPKADKWNYRPVEEILFHPKLK